MPPRLLALSLLLVRFLNDAHCEDKKGRNKHQMNRNDGMEAAGTPCTFILPGQCDHNYLDSQNCNSNEELTLSENVRGAHFIQLPPPQDLQLGVLASSVPCLVASDAHAEARNPSHFSLFSFPRVIRLGQ